MPGAVRPFAQVTLPKPTSQLGPLFLQVPAAHSTEASLRMSALAAGAARIDDSVAPAITAPPTTSDLIDREFIVQHLMHTACEMTSLFPSELVFMG